MGQGNNDLFALIKNSKGFIPSGVLVNKALQYLLEEKKTCEETGLSVQYAAPTKIVEWSLHDGAFFKMPRELGMRDALSNSTSIVAAKLKRIMQGNAPAEVTGACSAPSDFVLGAEALEAWETNGLWFLTHPAYNCYDAYLLPVPERSAIYGDTYCINSQDVATLLTDESYMKYYHRVVNAVCKSWGFVIEGEGLKHRTSYSLLDALGGRGWQHHSFRLRHMAVSLICFKQWVLASKVRAIAMKLSQSGSLDLSEDGRGETVCLTYNNSKAKQGVEMNRFSHGESLKQILNM